MRERAVRPPRTWRPPATAPPVRAAISRPR